MDGDEMKNFDYKKKSSTAQCISNSMQYIGFYNISNSPFKKITQDNQLLVFDYTTN